MFNKDQKVCFIIQTTKSSNVAVKIENIFNRIEHLEESYNKDVCAMTADEFAEVLKFICGVTHSTGERMLAFLRDYIKWCVEVKAPDVNSDLLSVDYDQEDNVRKGMYKSPAHLHETLEKIFYPVDLQSMHNIYRGYIWLAYMGLHPQEIETIEKTSVDFSRNIVVSETGARYIYMEAIPTFLSCVHQTDFRYDNNIKARGGTYFRERPTSPLLLSRLKLGVNCKEIANSMAAVLRSKKATSSFRFDRLHLSGVFYRMYQREVEDGLPVDFRLFAEEEVRIKRMYQRGITEDYAVISKTACLYKQDYNNWKAAFNL